MSKGGRKNRPTGEGESCLGHVYNEVPPCEDAQIFYTWDIRE